MTRQSGGGGQACLWRFTDHSCLIFPGPAPPQEVSSGFLRGDLSLPPAQAQRGLPGQEQADVSTRAGKHPTHTATGKGSPLTGFPFCSNKRRGRGTEGVQLKNDKTAWTDLTNNLPSCELFPEEHNATARSFCCFLLGRSSGPLQEGRDKPLSDSLPSPTPSKNCRQQPRARNRPRFLKIELMSGSPGWFLQLRSNFIERR